MKIGVDAKWYFRGPVSGRVVIQNLVKHLIHMNTEHDLYIFLNKKDRDQEFPYRGPRVHLIYIWGGINMLSNVFWVPLRAYWMKLDVFIFQNFAPFFSNFKRYSFIHDVKFHANPQYYTWIEKLHVWPIKHLSLRSHRVCTVSESEKKLMLEFGYRKSDSIDVIYHGVDPLFKPREQFDASELTQVSNQYRLPDEFLLYVGRLNIVKNIFNLLRAMPLLKDPDIPLVIVGDYEWKMTNIDSTLIELGIANRIHRTGPVYGSDLAKIFSMAKLFCFPSFAESFGLPALEAMAAGVPVVVSNSTSLPEICGDAGIYVDPNDPASIARGIDKGLGSDQVRKEKRILGLKRAGEFKWEYSADRLLKAALKTVDKQVAK